MKDSRPVSATDFAGKAPQVDRFAFSGEMPVKSAMTDEDFAEFLRARLQENGEHWAGASKRRAVRGQNGCLWKHIPIPRGRL